MNQQGAARRHEDDWWRELYGDGDSDGDGSGGEGAGEGAPARGAVCDAGPSDAPDTLDDRVASALRALGAPRWADPAPEAPPDSGAAGPAPWKPPGRPASLPPEPSSPIPLRSTGPGTRTASAGRPAVDRSSADRLSAGRSPADDSPVGRPSAAGSSADRSSAGRLSAGRPSADRPSAARPSADPLPAGRLSTERRAVPAPRASWDTPRPATTDLPGDRAPSHGSEPGELPAADPAALDDLVPDTTLDGARYGALTLRAAAQRGEAARRRGDVRRDALLTARFGAGRHALILIAVATGRPGDGSAQRAAREACTWIGRAVGRSYTRLAEDIRTDRRGALKSGLQRLTDRGHGKLRGRATEHGTAPEWYPAALRCLLLPADPDCRTRVFFGTGAGGLFLLRDGAWQDLEPAAGDRVPRTAGATGGPPRPVPGLPHGPYETETEGEGETEGAARPEPFLFRTVFARPADTLLLCSAGLAEPLREEPAFAGRLADRWSAAEPPGLVDFLAAAEQRVAGHPKDRTAVGVWET
ncbi:protein phosphatase 2C domain-containing protein [Streptomyces sp. NPDC054765]